MLNLELPEGFDYSIWGIDEDLELLDPHLTTHAKKSFDRHGFITITSKEHNDVKVFNLPLFLILYLEKLPLFDRLQNKDTVLNGLAFFQYYKEGYFNGVQSFNDNIKVSNEILYGQNGDAIVLKIYNQYKFKGIYDKRFNKYSGWDFVKKALPLIIRKEVLLHYGFYSGMISCADEFIKAHFELFQKYQPQNIESTKLIENTNHKIEIKPIFQQDLQETIFNNLKIFFSKEQQSAFKTILEDGNDLNTPLIFLDNGNRLADAFKQLIKSDIISGVEQQELEEWIYRNFKYRFRGEIRPFKLTYLNSIISTNKIGCKRPIFNVIPDKLTGKMFIKKM